MVEESSYAMDMYINLFPDSFTSCLSFDFDFKYQIQSP